MLYPHLNQAHAKEPEHESHAGNSGYGQRGALDSGTNYA